MIDAKAIFKAKREINDLLRKNPELRELQKDIELALTKAGDNPQNRMFVLRQLMMKSMLDMANNVNKLSSLIRFPYE